MKAEPVLGSLAREGRRRCMRPCRCWKGSAPPAASTATISPSSSSGPSRVGATDASASATSGNWSVFSLPRRDQIRIRGVARGEAGGSTSIRARMPSYLGSNTRSSRASSRSCSLGSVSTASIGLSAVVPPRQRAAGFPAAAGRAREPERPPMRRPEYTGVCRPPGALRTGRDVWQLRRRDRLRRDRRPVSEGAARGHRREGGGRRVRGAGRGRAGQGGGSDGRPAQEPRHGQRSKEDPCKVYGSEDREEAETSLTRCQVSWRVGEKPTV